MPENNVYQRVQIDKKLFNEFIEAAYPGYGFGSDDQELIIIPFNFDLNKEWLASKFNYFSGKVICGKQEE